MAYDRKYGVVKMERGTVGTEEPVVVFRAQDQTLPDLLLEYVSLCITRGSPREHIDIILDTRAVIIDWQHSHLSQVKVPRSEDAKIIDRV